MEGDILATLNQIKTAIYVLVAVVVAGVVANWVRAGVSIGHVVRNKVDDLFTEEAGRYFEEGKFDELVALCDKKLENKPNHSYALWYKAKGYYQKKEYGKSKLCFERLEIAEPSWSEAHVRPYLEKIEAIEKEKR